MIKGLIHFFAQIFMPDALAIVSACEYFQGHKLSGVELEIQSVSVVSWNIGMSLKQGRARTSSCVQNVAEGMDRMTRGTFSFSRDETLSFCAHSIKFQLLK
jgi:hypothetical protein